MDTKRPNRTGISAQIKKYGKYEFRRLMMKTRYEMDLRNLYPEFEVVPTEPVVWVKCRRCGKQYRLKSRSRQLSHISEHIVSDRVTKELIEGSCWNIRVRSLWRKVQIVCACPPVRGWLVEQVTGDGSYIHGTRRWWVKNPMRFTKE